MRSAVVVIALMFLALLGHSQEWSDKAHYEAYMKGDWKEVVRLGKEAKKAGADYYYIRARNGYANFMLEKYFKAEKEFEKALKFNGSDPFAKRYDYLSSVYAGNVNTGFIKAKKFSSSPLDTMKTIKPKWISSISVFGGYRFSTSPNFSIPVSVVGLPSIEVIPPSDMPYVSLYLSNQLGIRLTLSQAVSYLEQPRPIPVVAESSRIDVWQVGYLASLNIQVAKHTSVAPSFIMQYWEDGTNKVYDLSASLAVRQQFGNMSLTAIGGYFEDTDTAKFMAGLSFTWYPIQTTKFYSITSGGYNFGGDSPNPFVTQTIGVNVLKKLWARTSLTWNNQVISFEDIGIDFANNAADRINWRWSFTPSYLITDNLGMSVTYSAESRLFYIPEFTITVPSSPLNPNPLDVGVPASSNNYFFHSFYVGLNYNF